MIWQSRCCRNNAFLCLPSPMMNVLGSSRDFLPNADSANRRSGGFRGSPETEGIKGSSGSPAFCVMHTERCSCEGLCSAFSLVLAKAAGWIAQVSQAMVPSPGAGRGGGPEDKGGRVKSTDIISTLLDLSLILRASVQEGISTKTQHLLESSAADIPGGKTRACEDWKGLLCASTVLGAFTDILLVTLSAF